MKKNLFFSLFFLLFMGIIPVSCDLFCGRDSCGCGPVPATKDYIIKTLRLQTVTSDQWAYQEDRFYEYGQLGLTLEVEDYEFIGEVSTEYNQNWFVQTAMACSPIPPQSVQKISAISITAEDSFTYAQEQNFILGDDISDLFIINGITFSQYFSTEKVLFLGDNIFIKLSGAPSDPTTLSFTLKVWLSDGTEHEFTGISLKVK